ncbi:MAG: hypothetical protein WCE64_06665 [Bacteroidales bacterium]
MSKRIGIFLLAILFSGVALLGYFLHQGRKGLTADPYKAVGQDACLVIETIDLQSFINSLTTGKGLFSQIEKVKEFNNFVTKLKYLAEQLTKPGINKFIQEGNTLISFYPTETGELVPLLSKVIRPDARIHQVQDGLTASGVGKIYTDRLDGRKLIKLPFKLDDNIDTLFITISSGLILASTSGELLRSACNHISAGNDIRNAPGFSRVLLAGGKKEDKLFIVFGNLRQVAQRLFNSANASFSDRITHLGSSAGGDFYINEDGVVISGYSESSGPPETLFRFKSLEPAELNTYKVLPSSTAMFESMIMPAEQDTVAPGMPEGSLKSLADDIRPFIGDEVTRAYIDLKNRPVRENSLVLIRLKNRAQCEQVLNENIDRKLGITYFRPDDQTRIPIYFTANTGLVTALFPGFAPGFEDTCVTFYDNFLIAGNSVATLSQFLYDNILNKTLVNDLSYSEFEKMLPSRAGYLFYCVPYRLLDYLSKYLTSDLIYGLRSNKDVLNKVQSVGFQLASINGMIYNSLAVRYKDVVVEESDTQWETLLDTAAAIKPFFFTNHITGAREIFIQDLKNNVYLINAAGRVLWKVPLKERINGNVYMIDYYKNGKFQLLFAGKNNLHLLDRNGNYVDRFPVTLRSPATGPLALFDYDNNRNYRLFITGEDKLVYAYEKNGSVVKGWKPFRTTGMVKSEASYYRISGKDYIVVCDEYSIYFLDRSGNARFTPGKAVTRARGSSLRLAPGREPSLVCSSPDGTVQNIYFDGSVTKFSPQMLSFDHSFDFFDIDGDGFGEYIFIDKGILYLYDHNRNEMFRKDFGSDKLGGPITFIFSSSDRKIGVIDTSGNLIYLVDGKGEIMKGFPLKGASMFSIGRLSEGPGWDLIVGGTDNFLYNYKVDASAN